MNLEKAKEILNHELTLCTTSTNTDLKDAIRLGIEALYRVQSKRTGYESFAPDLLPGETEE